MIFNVVGDGFNEFGNARKRTPTNPLGRNLGEETFDGIEPRGTRGREVDVISRMRRKPLLNLGLLVGRVVVHNDVHVEFGRYISIDVLQKVNQLGMSMARQALLNDLPIKSV